MSRAPLLVLAIGNPSRGDDALGPAFTARAEALFAQELAAGRLELLTDFQLQVEHALDLEGRQEVLFVDASVSAAPPFQVLPLSPAADHSVSSHALSPAAVLETCARALGTPPPPARALALRGQAFGLGLPMSAAASAHLEAGLGWLAGHLGRPVQGVVLTVRGVVQGVGFRPFVLRLARALGLAGQVLNTPQGVRITLVGQPHQLDAFQARLRTEAPPRALVEEVEVTPLDPALERFEGFTIVGSQDQGPARLSMPPDLAVCDACLRDVEDPASRFFGYPFTSCTDCGPRYSIARGAPFDRQRTSMDAFPLCPACLATYQDPGDRRFHAQTLACPTCGPRLVVRGPDGVPTGEGLEEVAGLLREGGIVAVQGVGGFHLCCDATSPEAVARLRSRKHRERKPFAVLVLDAEAADRVGVLDPAARTALDGPVRPIVLVPLRPGALAPGVLAPEVTAGSSRVGLMRPSTPLHHLLARAVGRPLVCTSGNRSGEPIARTPAEALAALGAIADRFLDHDRQILHRAEDPVVAFARDGAPVLLRRARGQAPAVLKLPLSSPEPVLALGGHLKTTVCVVIGDEAWVGPHLGDLDTVEAEAVYQAELAAFEGLLGVSAGVLAHDAHPDYASTRLALRRPARQRFAVQHHLAHALAVAAERGLTGPVLAGIFDGTGLGPDGTAWGCELLLVDGADGSRRATLRALPLPGGERAIHEVWRVALAVLVDSFGPEAGELVPRLPLFQAVPAATVAAVGRQLAAGVNCPVAHGLGRLFDALGALLLDLPDAGFEAEVALRLEEAAAEAVAVGEGSAAVLPLPWTPADEGGCEALDFRPLVRHVVHARLAGRPASVVAAEVHNSLAAALAAGLHQHARATGIDDVVLGGGALQNRILRERLAGALQPLRVHLPLELSANDGALSLGQALFAVYSLHRQAAAAPAAPSAPSAPSAPPTP